MLKIKILNSHDIDSIGEFEFKYPAITIGSKINSTLRVFDSSAKEKIHLRIIDENKVMVIHPSPKGFLCNSKRFFLSTIVSKNDVIKLGALEIEITNISQEGNFPLNIKDQREKLLKKIKQDFPERLEILEAIEDDLINLGDL